MDLDRARSFMAEHHNAVLCTFRSDGRPQMSPVVVGVLGDGRPAISTRQTAYKVKNIRRDPRISLCVMAQGSWEWIQVDGMATIVPLPEAMELLVEHYRTVSGEHPDWDEYRQAMEQQKRVVLRIDVERAGPDRTG